MKEYFECWDRMALLDIKYPYAEMLEEARALSHRFVTHRYEDASGWEALVLHGLGEDKTAPMMSYGYKTWQDAVLDLHWTPAAQACPVTLDFLQNHFPCQRYGRVRFMKLRAGGHIALHKDSSVPTLENLNLVLNNPEGCLWHWEDGSTLHMEPGRAYAMNIYYPHAVYNNSNEDRYHMIIERHDATPEWKQLIEQSGARGRFFEHDALY